MISRSAVEREASLSFTKLMALCALSHDDEYVLSPKVKGNIKKWFTAATPFAKRFGLDPDTFREVVKGMYRNYSPIEHEPMVEVTEELAADIKAVLPSIDREHDVESHEYKILKDFQMVALKGSEPALSRIIKAISSLNDPDLSSLTKTEVNDQKGIVKQLEKHVTKMGGAGLEITPEMRKDFVAAGKESLKGKKLKEYNRLRKELNASPKQFIMQYVRGTGQTTVPVQDVLKHLKDAGIEHHSVPVGYRGSMDDLLGYYTETGLRLNGTPAGDVKMNPEYNPKTDNTYVCIAQAPMAKGPSRIYTVNYRQGNTEKKFEAVQKFQKVISKVKAKWRSHLKQGIDTKEGILALCCEIVYLTSARVGSKAGNTAGEKTFGLTSLQAGHYKLRGNSRLLEYKGKKSQIQKHLIKPTSVINKLCIQYLDELAEGKKRVETLITYRGKPTTGNAINKYLKVIGVPAGVTIHKFRTLRGTELANNALEKSPFKNRSKSPTAKQANDWLKKQLEKVAKELGHFTNGKLTVNTAIQNYIDPQILDNFFKEAGVRPNAVIARSIMLAKKD